MVSSVRVITGHFTEDSVEISLILVVNESIVEHALTLVAEQTENLILVSYLTGLRL